jgi:hypothetical protein
MHFSSLSMLVITIAVSEKKNPRQTMVSVMSMRDPRPGVFSSASFWAWTDRS